MTFTLGLAHLATTAFALSLRHRMKVRLPVTRLSCIATCRYARLELIKRKRLYYGASWVNQSAACLQCFCNITASLNIGIKKTRTFAFSISTRFNESRQNDVTGFYLTLQTIQHDTPLCLRPQHNTSLSGVNTILKSFELSIEMATRRYPGIYLIIHCT